MLRDELLAMEGSLEPFHPLLTDTFYLEWILENVLIEEAIRNYSDPQFWPPSNGKTPVSWAAELGIWRFDPVLKEFEVLTTIPTHWLRPTESDWNFAINRSAARYAKWIKEGHLPPPSSVFRHANGNLLTINRRRWLAAMLADLPKLTCWYSAVGPDGLSKWRLNQGELK